MEDTFSLIAFVLLLLCLSAFFSASEIAISAASRIRYKARAEDGDEKAARILKLLENNEKTITAIVVLNNIINILIPTLSTIIFISMIEREKLAIFTSTVTVTIILIFFAEILPKVYGKERNEGHLNRSYKIIELSIWIVTPISFFVFKFTHFFRERVFPKNTDVGIEVEDEILTMIEEGVEEGQLEESEEELIRNAIEFNDIRVEEILQPKSKMIMINVVEEHQTIFDTIIKERYSRMPVYDKDKDNIIGILSEREFLTNYIINKEFDLKATLRDVLFIPDTMKISKLLPELQNSHSHLAIVVDERGTVQGLVTVEDILEELVGEIWDEHDDIIHIYKKLNDNLYEISGEMTINDFNDLFDEKDIESEKSESTIAGYVLELAERIPEITNEFSDNIFDFKIIKMDGNKIDKMIVTKK